MSDGQKSMIINPRERALSNDINRLQTFLNTANLSLFSEMVEQLTSGDFTGWGSGQAPIAAGAVPHATIYGGLLPSPQPATAYFHISPGVAIMYAPESPADPDDSPYKFIADPGLTSNGFLSISSNAGGAGTRIDILECRPINVVTETDNRDIFDNSTGLFTPVTVDKVKCKRLSYRIREGIPNGGFPGLDPDWLPLTVISVPAGVSLLDGCTMWDVRPIVAGRQGGPGKDTLRNHKRGRQALGILTTSDFLQPRRQRGAVEIESGSPWKAGGMIRSGVYNLGANYPNNFEPSNTDNHDPTFTFTSGQMWHLYCVTTAFGLPRWAKYTAGPGARAPVEPTGIFVISDASSNAYTGTANVVLPSIYGLGSDSQTGIHLLSGVQMATGMNDLFLMPLTKGDKHIIEGNSVAGDVLGSLGILPWGIDLGGIDPVDNVSRRFQLTPGVTHPTHAKSVIVAFSIRVAPPGADGTLGYSQSFAAIDNTDGLVTKFSENRPAGIMKKTSGVATYIHTQMEFPVFPGEACKIGYGYNVPAGDGTVTHVLAFVRGWSFLVNPG